MAYGDLENISIKINRNQDLIKINNQQINLLTSTIINNEKKEIIIIPNLVTTILQATTLLSLKIN